MVFLVSQFLFILFVLLGIIVWAASDTPLAWREIAINTRRNPDQGSSYTMLKVLSACLKIFAVLLWIAGNRDDHRDEHRRLGGGRALFGIEPVGASAGQVSIPLREISLSRRSVCTIERVVW